MVRATLSRADDVAAVPALLEVDDVADTWSDIARWPPPERGGGGATRGSADLPAARRGGTGRAAPGHVLWADGATAHRVRLLLVVDLTSMWAARCAVKPLARAGAVVVKVESPTRPDGTRAGRSALLRLDESWKAE